MRKSEGMNINSIVIISHKYPNQFEMTYTKHITEGREHYFVFYLELVQAISKRME